MILVGDWAPGTKRISSQLAGPLILGNLEGPIVPPDHSLKPARKAGPSLFSTRLPAKQGRFAFSLANNHIMDYGVQGLEATLCHLGQEGFFACGAGNDYAEARQPLILEEDGVRIAILACCEAQFGVATEHRAGVAQFGAWVYDAIRKLRQSADAVVVSVHAALEDAPWPSPYIHELYRSYIDAGATIVHGHHAHVPQGYEEYSGGLILYGMGNFAVDPETWQDYPNSLWSLGAEVDFKFQPPRWHLMTFEIRHELGEDSALIQESTLDKQNSHWRYLEMCNLPFSDPELFAALWQEVALRSYYHYGATYMRFSNRPIQGWGWLAKEGLAILKRALLNGASPTRSPGQHEYMIWYHMIACESHRQMLATALGVLAGEFPDLRTNESRRLADELMPWSIDELRSALP
jgi:poly-gamma-glutamate synthesis protein (capsule biosynthesis protein)